MTFAGGRLSGRRVLVLEDEYFIAADLRRGLEAEGAELAGPTGDVQVALALVDAGGIDAAVLDVGLDGTTSYAVADRLAADAIPMMFLTGYDGWALAAEYRSAPRLNKPFAMADLLDRVASLVDGHPAPEPGPAR